MKPGLVKYGRRQRKQYQRPPQVFIDSWVDSYRRIGDYTLDEVPFFIRPITRETFKFIKTKKESEVEQLLCEYAMLWPEGYSFGGDEEPAGIISTLAGHVLEISGFTTKSAEELFAYWQEQVLEQDERWDLLIQRAFPGISFLDLGNMLGDEYFHYLAAATFLMRVQLKTASNPEYSPDELVNLLLCDKDALMQRLEEADTQQQQRIQEENALAQQKQAKQMAGAKGPYQRR